MSQFGPLAQERYAFHGKVLADMKAIDLVGSSLMARAQLLDLSRHLGHACGSHTSTPILTIYLALGVHAHLQCMANQYVSVAGGHA